MKTFLNKGRGMGCEGRRTVETKTTEKGVERTLTALLKVIVSKTAEVSFPCHFCIFLFMEIFGG